MSALFKKLIQMLERSTRWFVTCPITQMDFTPEDIGAVQSCLEGIDRNVPVAIEPAAAKLLMPNTVRTVADILALTEWPAEQLRLVVERWQPAAEVRIERIR